jgi:hypothetical protein
MKVFAAPGPLVDLVPARRGTTMCRGDVISVDTAALSPGHAPTGRLPVRSCGWTRGDHTPADLRFCVVVHNPQPLLPLPHIYFFTKKKKEGVR